MRGDIGVEDRRDCAVKQGRRCHELTGTRAYRGDGAEEIGRRDLFQGKAQGHGAGRSVQRIRARESRFMRQR